MALYNPQRQINSRPQVQFQLRYVFSAVGSRCVLYAQSHHRDQRTNLCHSPLATMSWRRLTSPSRVNRKMNPGRWGGGGYKQWLLTSVLREIGEMLLFQPVLFSVFKNKNKIKTKRWKYGALGKPPELSVACFSLSALYCLCRFMFFSPWSAWQWCNFTKNVGLI